MNFPCVARLNIATLNYDTVPNNKTFIKNC